MLKHYVLFKFQAGFFNQTYLEEFQNCFSIITQDIDGVLESNVYLNAVDRTSNMDVMIEMTLKEKSVLDQYLKHPKHVQMGEKFNPYIINRVSFDYILE